MNLNNLYIDNLSGEDFEKYLSTIFQNLGYKVSLTSKSNDYGADLIIEKDNIETVVQAKRYNSAVGVSAIQEILGAKGYYNAKNCLVVTNNYFTSNAIKLSSSNNVQLWDRDKLIKIAILSLKPNITSNYSKSNNRTIYLKDLICSNNYNTSNNDIYFILGKDVSENIIIPNICDTQHILITGTTGSGKSTLIHSLIISILNKYSSNDVKFILIDPKVIELNVYNGIPNLMIPPIIDSRKACGALNWACCEIKERCNLFSKSNVKNIQDYKNNIKKDIPFILIIIDEISYFLDYCPKDIKQYIKILTQMGRTVGIYLIVTTQIASIAKTFKDYFPTKISFFMPSQSDMKSILNYNFTDNISKPGDMIFYPLGANNLLKLQGTYISEKEVTDFVSPIKVKTDIQNIKNSQAKNSDKCNNCDELLDKALKIVIVENQASTSLLQRKLNIGYNRAAIIIDQMEEKGYVSQKEEGKPRKILISNNPNFYNTKNKTNLQSKNNGCLGLFLIIIIISIIVLIIKII